MTGQRHLPTLLAGLAPLRRPGEYVFVTVGADHPAATAALASVVEAEGLSLLLSRAEADRQALRYDYLAGWITLQTHSSLAAIGLTAVVAGALAEADISCNVIAGYHHDHLLVPIEKVEQALDVLARLSAAQRSRELSIRRAGPADVAAMTALARAAFARYVQRIGREPAPMTTDYAECIEHAWLAERDGELVGQVVLSPQADHLQLDDLAVAPPAQRLGIGTALLALAERQARAAGLAEIRLYTNAAMTENLEFYPRHGYRETHRASEHGFQRVYFSKRVPPA